LKLDESSADPEQEAINDYLVEFVKTAALLRSETVLGQHSAILFSAEEARNALDDRCSTGRNLSGKSDPNQPVFDTVVGCINRVGGNPTAMKSLEFEKDSDSNGHVAFISAASNLRATCYGIPPVDAMETRRIAGNIVPAMITTTSFVSALSCIEFVKLAQRKPLQAYRNAFINLALPFFAFTVPLRAEEIPGFGESSYTLWDRIIVAEDEVASAEGGITMKSFLRQIREQLAAEAENVSVISVSYGPFMLFADFLHGEDEELLRKSLWDLAVEAVEANDAFESDFSRQAERAQKSELPTDIDFLELNVIVEDLLTGEEVEIPPVRVDRFKV
jgi:ubiquitin-activating enzyme E1